MMGTASHAGRVADPSYGLSDGLLADFVKEPTQRDVELLVGLVRPFGDLGPDLIDPVPADIGHVLHLPHQPAGFGDLHLVLDRA